MIRYLISRLLIVFLIKFFGSWAINIQPQLSQFFDLSIGFIFNVSIILTTFLVLGLGLLVINLLFSIFHLTEVNSLNEIIEKIGNKGFLNILKSYAINFRSKLSENFEIERKLEKYPNLFIILVLFFLLFSKGNPILNNYYGIYKEYEIENQGRYGESTDYIEDQYFIVHKSEINEINSRVRKIEENAEEDEPYFNVKKRGYLFVQAGIIDGYKTDYKEYKGSLSYIECLLFSAIEKLINSIMYFLTPFILCISIYHYNLLREKRTDNR